MKALINIFVVALQEKHLFLDEVFTFISGLIYYKITFCAALRGSVGLKLDLCALERHFTKSKAIGIKVLNVVAPLRGR